MSNERQLLVLKFNTQLFVFSLFFQLLLMGRLKLGFMIAWDQEWIMMPLGFGVP